MNPSRSCSGRSRSRDRPLGISEWTTDRPWIRLLLREEGILLPHKIKVVSLFWTIISDQ